MGTLEQALLLILTAIVVVNVVLTYKLFRKTGSFEVQDVLPVIQDPTNTKEDTPELVGSVEIPKVSMGPWVNRTGIPIVDLGPPLPPIKVEPREPLERPPGFI